MGLILALFPDMLFRRRGAPLPVHGFHVLSTDPPIATAPRSGRPRRKTRYRSA